PTGFQSVSLTLLIPIALATAGVTLFLVGSIVKAHRGRVQVGGELLARAEAIADEEFAFDGVKYVGMVRTQGELWRAVSLAPVVAGQPLAVEGREGLTLLVRSAEGS